MKEIEGVLMMNTIQSQKPITLEHKLVNDSLKKPIKTQGFEEKVGEKSKQLSKEKNSKISFDISELNDEEKENLNAELEKHNAEFAYTGKLLKFKFNEEAKSLYVEVIDSATQEVIVSLPPEFLIDLSVRMKELVGMYIDEKL